MIPTFEAAIAAHRLRWIERTFDELERRGVPLHELTAYHCNLLALAYDSGKSESAGADEVIAAGADDPEDQ